MGVFWAGTVPAYAGWEYSASGWWFQNSDGTYPAGEWKEIDNQWYYFDANGYISVGWVHNGGNWYYCNSDGSLAVNCWIDGTYYVGSDGAMYVNQTMPDGYKVGADGAYIQEDINQAAMAAYVQHLEGNDYLELEEHIKYVGDTTDDYHTPEFACVDIDGDGVNELFVSKFAFWDFDMEYYRYNGSYVQTMSNVLDDISSDGVAFNRDAQEMVAVLPGRQMNILARYKYDGTQIDYMEFERDFDFESMKAIYFDPYHTLNFVENTRKNR